VQNSRGRVQGVRRTIGEASHVFFVFFFFGSGGGCTGRRGKERDITSTMEIVKVKARVKILRAFSKNFYPLC